MYPADAVFPVYDREVWWSDAWDPLPYGRPFDSARPFFDQFHDLLIAVPRIALQNKDPENSEYCNFAAFNKNCYLCFGAGRTEDGYHCNRTWDSRSVCDCTSIADCELCYEVIDSDRCYHCVSLRNCSGCRDCSYGFELQNCHDCIACFGLRNASYCIGNERLGEEKYKERAKHLLEHPQEARVLFERLSAKLPRKCVDGINTERCSGNAISHSKNCRNCYYVKNAEDCKFFCNATNQRDSYDVDNDDHSELVYEAIGSETNYMHTFNDICWFDKNMLYCSLCFHSEHCFGCIGLKHKKYCILNRQYSKEEYEVLVPQIIRQMRKFGEYGEFFPTAISPFPYNETIAQESHPLVKDEAVRRGLSWRDPTDDIPMVKKTIPASQLPATIAEVPDDILDWAIRCEATGRPFKIIKPELAFYRIMQLPIPHFHPDERHRRRIAQRNPRHLWSRACAKCGKGIETTYAPERPEIVYCENCYLKEIY